LFQSPEFAGVHFTGSTGVFNQMWETIGKNVANYRSYPRIVGETGGKDFVIAHHSADPQVVATALLRGAFEYQGQKCSAASRAYVPSNMAAEVRQLLVEGINSFSMGPVDDFSNFINAVIDEKVLIRSQSTLKKPEITKQAKSSLVVSLIKQKAISSNLL
jgi:1-pyrroline-5-carboxylate dehydrogenase